MQTRTCPRCSTWFEQGQVKEEFSGICPKCLSQALLEAPEAAPAAPAPGTPLLPGARFGGFEILEVLGRGGMGVVYKARQTSLDRIVALKVLAPRIAGSADFARRFDHEAKLLASLNHPNVVQVHDFGREADVPFLVMEYVDGESLEASFRKGAPDPVWLLRILRDVARGLGRVHEAGLVHRDLKPANIFIARDGAAKIGDFGLATESGSGPRLTDHGYFIGSPHYVSPEHARDAEVDARSDLYALGVILFEGFEGHPPFQSKSPTGVLAKHIEEPVPPMARAPREAQKLVRSLLKKSPSDRPASAAQVAATLDHLLSPTPPSRRFAAAIAAAAALLILALGIAAWRLRPPSTPAEAELSWTRPAETGWTDLLSLIDPQRDAVSGAWAWKGKTLVSDKTERAKLAVRYQPPAEYDYRVVFSRIQGIGDVNLILSKGGRSFAWCMGGMGNTQGGFGSIRGRWAPEKGNPSRVKLAIEPGRIYEARVEVRRTGVTAFLNGDQVCEWLTDYTDLSLDGPWSLHDDNKLGVGTFTSPTRFHSIEVREIR
jgi:predicted Ser/Thr protein kinase